MVVIENDRYGMYGGGGIREEVFINSDRLGCNEVVVVDRTSYYLLI